MKSNFKVENICDFAEEEVRAERFVNYSPKNAKIKKKPLDVNNKTSEKLDLSDEKSETMNECEKSLIMRPMKPKNVSE